MNKPALYVTLAIIAVMLVFLPLPYVALLFVPLSLYVSSKYPSFRLAIYAALVVLGYVLLPTLSITTFVNTQGAPINATMTVTPHALIAISTSLTSTTVYTFILQGDAMLTYTSPYRKTLTEPLSWRWIPFRYERIVLEPDTFTFATTTFIGPYGMTYHPQVLLEGNTLDHVPYATRGNVTTPIPYGMYTATFTTPALTNTTLIHFDVPHTILLWPGNNSITLTSQEAHRIRNFISDYIELASERIIPDGWPRQYHLYTHNTTLSLGDMLFVLCQLGEAEQPVLYIPKNRSYDRGGDGCYSALAFGNVPFIIDGQRIEQYFYDQLSDTVRSVPYNFEELNQKYHTLDWALSYDVEYGRYVPETGVTEYSTSTCAIAPEYLTPEECANPDFAGWTTDAPTIWWYGEYGYPVSSGMIGWRYILELGSRYGIPTTQYMVSKDISLFNKTDPLLFDLSKTLVDERLIEVGGHTRYHTRLDKVNESIAFEELAQAKQDLERAYTTRVFGARNPYLSLVNNNTQDTERALRDAGYTYYSHYGRPTLGLVEHKPITFFGYMGYARQDHLDAAFMQLPYSISLDHPWNIQFHEKGEPVYLEENPKQPIQTKALILQAMSRGAHFTTVQDIDVQTFKST